MQAIWLLTFLIPLTISGRANLTMYSSSMITCLNCLLKQFTVHMSGFSAKDLILTIPITIGSVPYQPPHQPSAVQPSAPPLTPPPGYSEDFQPYPEAGNWHKVLSAWLVSLMFCSTTVDLHMCDHLSYAATTSQTLKFSQSKLYSWKLS